MAIKRIAVQPDVWPENPDQRPTFRRRWLDHLRGDPASYEVVEVNLYQAGGIARIAECDAFLWRWRGADILTARRVVAALEAGAGIPCLPSASVALLARDKIHQQFLLESAGLPIPRTWSFADRANADAFIRSAGYPLVAKLAGGFRSEGVALIRDAAQAAVYVDEMFRFGVTAMYQATGSPRRRVLRHARQAALFMAGRQSPIEREGAQVCFQEFLPGNGHDTRVTIIGRYATAFRRFNRPDDFRASGSGSIDWDTQQVDPAIVEFAFHVSNTLRLPFIAVDVLRRGSEFVVCELNSAYHAWAVARCPAHWYQAEGGAIEFREGGIDPEVLTLTEFLWMHQL